MEPKASKTVATINREVQNTHADIAFDVERIRVLHLVQRLRVTPVIGRVIAEHAFSTMEAAAR